MASISRDKNGTKRVLFTDGDGQRRSVRLGRVQIKHAETFRLRIEALLATKELHQSPDADLSAWLRDLPDRMYSRLIRAALVQPRNRAEVVTVGALLKRFSAAASVKDSTRAAYRQTTDSLLTILGEDTPLGRLTTADADNWRKAISEPKDGESKRLAPATVAKRVHVAKAIFRKAIKWGMIPASPFSDLRAGSQANPDRAFYVSIETTRAILAACPDDQWRAIVALCRFAGLRCPSEIVALRWGDINWARGALTVRSPKTAGHEGHAVRMVPIVPELRAILQDLFDAATEGVEMVVPRLREPAVNLRTTFGKIVARASVKPWPRPFQNMRASCATDWVARFPAHEAAKWLGHSPLIAAQHYWQPRDANFDLATGGASAHAESGAKSGAHTAQRAAQRHAAGHRTDSPDSSKGASFTGVPQAEANESDAAAKGESGRYWIRTTPENKANTVDSDQSGAKSGAFGSDSTHATTPPTPTDPDLAAVVAAWADLPPAIRAGVLALVKAAGK